jgi:hypothetical protein
MGVCIFCEEEVDDDTEECPHCHNKPFSGMYFDESTYAKVDALEKQGKLKDAWDILYEEWRQHTDVEYFDQDMAGKLYAQLEAFFERHPILVEQRLEMLQDEIMIAKYWGAIDSKDVEKGIKIAQDAERLDLELKFLEEYSDIAFSGSLAKPSESLKKRIAELKILSNNEIFDRNQN